MSPTASGGPRDAATAPAGLPVPLAALGLPLPEGTPGLGPLVRAAYGLLLIAPRLRRAAEAPDPSLLRRGIEAELERFKDRARAAGVDAALIDSAHAALCSLLDDAVQGTPWAREEPWRSGGLAMTLHGDRSGGERFFELLGKARAEPARTHPLLELMDACLAMGFEGRFRHAPGGASALMNLRTDLSAKLASMGLPRAEGVSPSWRGVPPPRHWLRGRVPSWVGGVAALTLLALVFVGFDQRLGTYSEGLGSIIARLAPPAEAGTTATVPALAPTPLGRSIEGCLAAQGIKADLIADGAGGLRLRLPATPLFRDRSADLDPTARPALRCLGSELEGAKGQLVVVGHTDDVPTMSPRFPSNWELSLARATAIGQALLAGGAVPRSIVVEGRADAEPRASNTEARGRAQNRRVEILLLK